MQEAVSAAGKRRGCAEGGNRALAEKGYKEVVLTGIHLSSYGVDFPEDQKETLLSLIRAVHEIEGIRRIRLGSLEPGIVTENLRKGSRRCRRYARISIFPCRVAVMRP